MPADPEGDPSVAVALAASLVGAVGSVVRGKDEVVRLSVVALLAGGHLLVEDLPGTGKTLLAKSLATAIGGRFGRVQCTPDLLPSDITGTSVYAPVDGSWNFRAGPLFANVVLVDEVNRASPRTQAALLEPMEEHQVSIDGTTYGLPDPFFCIATQNPYGQIGTFPLPESQLDRFALVLSMGLPDRAAEREILTGQGGAEVLGALASVTTPDEVAAAVLAVRHVFVAPALVEYVLDLTAATRTHPELTVGASPRASTGLLHAARAHAVVAGRSHLTPDDVQAVAGAAFAHRVAVGGSVDTAAARRIIADVVARTPVPRP
ncbi:MoxR family ATPase [Aquihabitans sp. G128]|nr:MoxR family ATPase [Aquihabitans sp. G128]